MASGMAATTLGIWPHWPVRRAARTHQARWSACMRPGWPWANQSGASFISRWAALRPITPQIQLFSSWVSWVRQRVRAMWPAAPAGSVLPSFTRARVTSSLVRWRTAVSLSSRYLSGWACTVLDEATHSGLSMATAWLVMRGRLSSAPRRARCHTSWGSISRASSRRLTSGVQASSASFWLSQSWLASVTSSSVSLPWVASRACRLWQRTCLSSRMRYWGHSAAKVAQSCLAPSSSSQSLRRRSS